VRDDEVRVGDLPVDRERGQEDPERPPIVKTPMKPSAHSIGVSNEMFPRQSVASQLKIFTPVGIAMIIELIMKKMSSRSASRREHVVRPHEQRVERDADRRDRDRLVAEDRLAREHGQHLGDDPPSRAGS
jgi:hypothetical protein